MLYLVATPIGNLADITLRALETLKACDYILCEDTRHSLILLQHYLIQKPLKSYHKFNEASAAESILRDLKEGKNICLVSDAGTPGISDPGAELVKLCIENDLPITALPGPCAAIQAISCSGLPTDRFQFLGFLPKKEEELKRQLYDILNYPGTTLCYESPHRLVNVLELIDKISPDCHLVVARELTKKFEEIVRGSAGFLIQYWNTHTLKGEIVLLFSPVYHGKEEQWKQWTPQDHVKWIEETYNLSKKDAIKLAAEQRDVPKRQIYKEFI